MVVDIKNGSLAYGNKKALSDINLTIEKGEFVVICGESGSGKSSLIRVLNGLVPELYEGELSGDFTVLGQKLPASDFNRYVREIGMVFQNPKTQFFMNDVYSELAFPMENCGETQDTMKNRIKKISNELNITSYWAKSLHDLSGGEKQRVAFSSACVLPHQLFLLDEPSSNLDDKHTQLIKNYLLWLKQQKQTIIVAEHRLFYLMPLVDRFILMKDGRLFKELSKSDLIEMSSDELSALNLRSFKLSKRAINKPPIESDKFSNQLMCEAIRFSYKKCEMSVIIKNVSFNSNEITAIVGENGAGKTTFSQLLTGMLKPHSGCIYYNGQKQTRKQLIKKSFLIMQDVNLQLFFESVEKEITTKAKRLDLKEVVIDTLNLRPLLKKHPQTLSGGQKQCVAIATAVLSGKQIIVMDEPTSGLDLKSIHEVKDLVTKLKQFNVIVIIVSHDKEFINLCCDRVVQMTAGKLE